jgi:hypothetical protein
VQGKALPADRFTTLPLSYDYIIPGKNTQSQARAAAKAKGREQNGKDQHRPAPAGKILNFCKIRPQGTEKRKLYLLRRRIPAIMKK